MGIIDNIYENREKYFAEQKAKALNDAERIIKILLKKFEAKRVILYGSLLTDRDFTHNSDIDLAVQGLQDNFLSAYAYCMDKTEFKLDLKPYESLYENFKAKIETKSKIYYG